MTRWWLVVAVVPILTRAALARDRDGSLLPPSMYAGGGVEVAQAVGEFEDYMNVAGGGAGQLTWRPNAGRVGLRLAGTFLVYGSQTRRYPVAPGVLINVTTTNNIASMSAGPLVVLGPAVAQLYAHAGIGFSYFVTTSDAKGSNSGSAPFARSTNYSDATFASDAGGGFLFRTSEGRHPVLIDVGVRFQRNGRVTYVTKDRMRLVGGELVIDPVTSEANLIVYRIGVMIGLRKPDPNARRPR